MKKKVAVVSVADAEEAARLADLPLEATVALAEVAGAIKDGLLAFASATGLVVTMHQMMQAELTESIGQKHTKIGAAERSGNWHGTTKGSVVLGGRQVSTERPRGRTTAGTEIELDTWKAFSSADLLNSLVVERMLAGVATRRHQDVAEPVGKELESRTKSMSKSAVSRRFVAATTTAMADLMARNLADLDVAVIMIDGLEVAGSCVVACLVSETFAHALIPATSTAPMATTSVIHSTRTKLVDRLAVGGLPTGEIWIRCERPSVIGCRYL